MLNLLGFYFYCFRHSEISRKLIFFDYVFEICEVLFHVFFDCWEEKIGEEVEWSWRLPAECTGYFSLRDVEGFESGGSVVGSFHWFFKSNFDIIWVTFYDFSDFLGSDSDIFIFAWSRSCEANCSVYPAVYEFDIWIFHHSNTIFFLVFYQSDILSDFWFWNIDDCIYWKRELFWENCSSDKWYSDYNKKTVKNFHGIFWKAEIKFFSFVICSLDPSRKFPRCGRRDLRNLYHT